MRLFIAEDSSRAVNERAASELSRVHPNLDIVYEDANILLLNKRPGVLVHDDAEGQSDTLLLHAKAYLYQKELIDPAANDPLRLRSATASTAIRAAW